MDCPAVCLSERALLSVVPTRLPELPTLLLYAAHCLNTVQLSPVLAVWFTKCDHSSRPKVKDSMLMKLVVAEQSRAVPFREGGMRLGIMARKPCILPVAVLYLLTASILWHCLVSPKIRFAVTPFTPRTHITTACSLLLSLGFLRGRCPFCRSVLPRLKRRRSADSIKRTTTRTRESCPRRL